MPLDTGKSDHRFLGDDEILAEKTVAELAMDSMHILPLSAMPLRTATLKRARLVKNIRLESMIELFGGSDTGSGQIHPLALKNAFEWPEKSIHPDERMVLALAALPSFDVYSLRMQLRKLGVDANTTDSLKLSDAKSSELTARMAQFTMPLLRQVYGTTNTEITSVSELLRIFSTPDRQEALQNLKAIAGKLGIGLMGIPKFLEEYGDVYLSLAYYRDCLDTITPQMLAFEESVADLRSNHQLSNDRRLMHCIDEICETVSNLTQSVLNRFTEFDRNSAEMWNDLSAVSFNRVKEAIRRDHVAIGGILCGLSLKMGGWERTFKPGSGVVRRAEFIMSDMIQGLDLIGRVEEKDPDCPGPVPPSRNAPITA